jgi:hypothetical protein
VPAAHGLLHSIKHALPHVHRHALHAVRHATRAAIRHPKVIAGAGCRAAPLLLASNILAVPLPIYAPPEAAVQPVATTQPAPNLQRLPPLPAFPLAPAWTVLSPSEVAKLALIEPFSGAPVSVPDPADPAAPADPADPVDPADPADPVLVQSQGNVTPVPEPSSLIVFAAALTAVRLLRRRLPNAVYVPQKVCSTRSSSCGPRA